MKGCLGGMEEEERKAIERGDGIRGRKVKGELKRNNCSRSHQDRSSSYMHILCEELYNSLGDGGRW